MKHSNPRAVHRAVTLLAAATTLGGIAVAQTTFEVDTTDDTVDVMPGDGICADVNGNCSLRAAIQEANALGGAFTIRLAPSETYTLTRAGAGEDLGATGDLDVNVNLAIEGRGATIDADGLDRIFDVFYRNVVVLDELTLVGGAVTNESGGAIRSAGSVTLDSCAIDGCTAFGAGASGGGIFNDAGFVALRLSTIEGCSAERAGGAIEANGGDTRALGSILTGNMAGAAPGNGGAFHLTGDGSSTFRWCVVTDNIAAREGGGLWNSSSGQMWVELCDIRGNSAEGMAADDGGGGLFNDGGVMHVRLSDVRNNRAMMGSGSGGGLFNNAGDLFVTLTSIDGNRSNRAGGGIEALAGTTDVSQSSLTNNATGASPGNGGGLHLTGPGIVRVAYSGVADNTASAEGGGLWNSAVGTMDVIGCRIVGNVASGNDADQGGGGLFNDGGTMSVDLCSLEDNVADGTSGSGGGIFNLTGDLDVRASRIVGNVSQRAGGGVEAREGMTRLLQTRLEDNETGASPGNGGGLHLTGAGLVEVHRCDVLSNDATAEGGGLWNSATGTMTVTDTTIVMNMAPLGADVFNDGGTFTIDGVPVP